MKPEKNYKIPAQPFLSDDCDKLSDQMVNHATPQDERSYFISFSNYKKKSCEIRDLESGSPKKIVNWIKDIGSSSSPDDLESCFKKTKPKSVRNNNHYSELFSNLSPDVEMQEIYLNGSNRLFYYIDHAVKVVNCILIKSSHFETKKVKR